MSVALDERFGSKKPDYKLEMKAFRGPISLKRDFRFTPKSSHPADELACPFSANSRYRAIATAERTGGALSLVEAHGFKGTEPPIHYYEGADEFFHSVAGDMTFVVGR